MIEARTIGAAKDIQVKMLPCRVQKLERLADDVIVLQLKLPANERLQFLAGQYLEFLLKDGSRRSFSMGNAPHDDELIELHVRHVAGGQFTDHVFGKMKERDILRFEAPLGTFFLREDSDKPIVFVASGTGFAPIKSIIEHAFHKGIKRPMVLYWGGRRPKDLYMNALAEKWAAEHPQHSSTCRSSRTPCPRTTGQGARASCTAPSCRTSRTFPATRSTPAACRSWWTPRARTSPRSAGCRKTSSTPTASPPRPTWRPAAEPDPYAAPSPR